MDIKSFNRILIAKSFIKVITPRTIVLLTATAIIAGCTPSPANLKDAAESAGEDSIKASVDATLEAMRTDPTATPTSDKGGRGAAPPPPIKSTPSAESTEPGETCDPDNYGTGNAPYIGQGNGKIVFTGEQYGSSMDIYVMDADGWDMLPNTSGGDGEPKWSPNGSKIAFVSDGGASMGDIFVMDADGHNRAKIANTLYYEDSPVWSPDGSEIAFTSDRDGNWDIFIMNADGSNQRNITNSPSNEYQPTWSPDGSRIAFSSDLDGFDIYMVDADGSNLANITNSQEAEFDPSWSPDAGKIAFSSDRDGSLNIHIMDTDGSNNTNLTYKSGSDQSQEPEWSPDGSKIVFSDTGPCGHSAIWVMDSDGENSRLIWEFSNGDSYSPHWELDESTAAAADVSNIMTVIGRVMWNNQPVSTAKIVAGIGDSPETATNVTTSPIDSEGYFSITYDGTERTMLWVLTQDDEYLVPERGAGLKELREQTTTVANTLDLGIIVLEKKLRLITPDNETSTTTTPTFTWEAIPNAVNYHVIIDDFYDSPAEEYEVGNVTEFQLTEPLTTDTKYAWYVTAFSDSGWAIASNIGQFFNVVSSDNVTTTTPEVVNYDLDIIRGITPDGAYHDGEPLQTVMGIRGVPYEFIGWQIEGADETAQANIAWGDGEYHTIHSQELMQNSGVIAASHIYSSGGVYFGYIDVVSNGTSVANSTFTVFINEVSTETTCDATNPYDFIVSGFSFQGENDTFRKVDNLGNELGDTCGVEGLYQRPIVENFYHKGIISQQDGEYFWNNLGVSNWQLYPEFDLSRFTTDSNNPYFSESPYFTLFRGDADIGPAEVNGRRSTGSAPEDVVSAELTTDIPDVSSSQGDLPDIPDATSIQDDADCDETKPTQFVASGFTFQGEDETFLKVDDDGNTQGNTCGILGMYQRFPVLNDWHTGIISYDTEVTATGETGNSQYRWTNNAGSSWPLYPEFHVSRFNTDSQNPYYDYPPGESHPYFTIFAGHPDISEGDNRKRPIDFFTTIQYGDVPIGTVGETYELEGWAVEYGCCTIDDEVTAKVNWGDSDQTVPVALNSDGLVLRNIQASHVYESPGEYNGKIMVFSKGILIAEATFDAVVRAAS